MAFEVSSGFHAYTRKRLCVILRDLSHCDAKVSISYMCTHRSRVSEDVQLVSARSSFFLLILSFNPSASLLAAVILACICSEVMSADMLTALVPVDLRKICPVAQGVFAAWRESLGAALAVVTVLAAEGAQQQYAPRDSATQQKLLWFVEVRCCRKQRGRGSFCRTTRYSSHRKSLV